MSINRVIICGNLTRDGELRTTASGTNILNLGIAVNERYKNSATGEWEDRPNYFDCVMFGSRAESLAQYLTKGVKVVIDGKLRWSQWEKDGQKHNKVEIIVDNLDFASSKPRTEQPAQPVYAAPQQPSIASVYDEDIPF
jgi:single-strand DNA-binding protein